MIKFINNDDKQLIFNYLDIDRSALMSAVTEFYPDSYITDGVFSIQYNKNEPVSLTANGDSFSLLFPTGKSDFDELGFVLKNSLHSPVNLPFRETGRYYLMKKENEPKISACLGNIADFKAVLRFNNAEETVNLQYLFKKGHLIPFTLEHIGGGFVINSENYSVISHIFVKDNLRKRGNGTVIVKNLLSLSSGKNVYLICDENNLDFYGRLGFCPVLTVYKYDL